MNFRHAIGFMIVGAVLGSLPQLAPEWCPATGVDGSSTRALWLQIMSYLQLGLAGCYFLRRAASALAAALVYSPATGDAATATSAVARPVAAPRLQPVWARRRRAVVRSRPRSVLPLPVAFNSALLDRRAA